MNLTYYVLYIVVFLFGLLFGSFLNVCIYRIPRLHLMLTDENLAALRQSAEYESRAPSGQSFVEGFIIYPLSTFLQFLGLHQGWQRTAVIPSEVLDRLEPLIHQHYVTLNDFADALEAQLTEEQLQGYGDAIFQHATRKPESIVWPGSHCPSCKQPISPRDNIPVISFLLLGGKCRHCGETISWRYPLIELLTATLYTLISITFGLSAETFVYIVFASMLLVISLIDLDHQLIPDIISVPGIGVGLLAIPVSPIRWQNALLGLLIGGGIIWLVGFFGKLVFKKEAMGGGDIKLMAMIGVFLGWKMVLLTLFFGSITGAVIGIIMRLITHKEYIPFGPFLSLGALLALFFGAQLFSWYFSSWDQLFFP